MTMACRCDRCCAGVSVQTPASVANPPGLDRLRYRTGTHRQFLATMLARLSATTRFPALEGLTTRDLDDISIALLDSWATAADVLTFYGERAVTEFFLRTATRRDSLVELGRLVGYEPRPGVAASTHLAFTMEVGGDAPIPAGTRVQNVPVQGRLPQAYETSEQVQGHVALNRIGIRLSAPQKFSPGKPIPPSIWVKGTATGLAPGTGILVVFPRPEFAFGLVQAVEVDTAGDRTRLWLASPPEPAPPVAQTWTTLLARLHDDGGRTPAQPRPVGRVVTDTEVRVAALLAPHLAQQQLYQALSAVTPTEPPPVKVYALRVTARIFGHNAPLKPKYRPNGLPEDPAKWVDWDQPVDQSVDPPELKADAPKPDLGLSESKRLLYLDRVYPGISNGSFVVLHRPDLDAGSAALATMTTPPTRVLVGTPVEVGETSRTMYGLNGACTLLRFGAKEVDGWFTVTGERRLTMDELRRTVVYTGSQLLELADEPMTDPVCGPELELDGVYEGLRPGRLLAVSGDRSGLGVPGVRHSEIARIADVRHVHTLAGQRRAGQPNRTLVTLDRQLRFCLVRDTVTVAGNVAHATHGETRSEILGSGDATVPYQTFTLRSGPLTHVPADTPTGIAGTLELRVDDVLWPRRPSLVTLGPQDRGYLVRVGDDGRSAIVFGNGRWGRRLPTGVENVRARYRAGIGTPGNVDPGAITLLATRPLGVKDVTNPVPATGGADPESGDDIRGNVAVPLRALDRLVSRSDYADFARAFGGIGKATADRLVVRGLPQIVVTVAGAGDSPIDDGSDLRHNLARALRRFGDPLVGVRVLVRRRLVVRLNLTVTIEPDFDWPVVAAAVRTALLDAFGFARRDLGQSLYGSEVLAVAHGVRGVRRCVVDLLTIDPAPPSPAAATVPGPVVVARPARGGDPSQPAEIACLMPDLPELLVITRGV
jgi:predicted phage baseplate assembly protein